MPEMEQQSELNSVDWFNLCNINQSAITGISANMKVCSELFFIIVGTNQAQLLVLGYLCTMYTSEGDSVYLQSYVISSELKLASRLEI